MESKSVAERLASLPTHERDNIIKGFSDAECKDLLYDWEGFLARPDQIEPDGYWEVWLILSGRGWGKTRTGAEWVKKQMANGCMRMAIIGETQKDLEKVMVEGDSGLLSVFPPDECPTYVKKPVELRFPNGALIQGYNATEPEQLRGPQFEAAWCDEPAKWRYGRETWDQLQFGLRLGENPRVVVTTTPRPTSLIKDMVAGNEGKVHVTRGKTADNRSNLSTKFIEKIEKRYAGTRLGRQELNGELLGDLPGALWQLSQIDMYRVAEVPQDLERILIAVDPAVTNTENSDYHGIVAGGVKGNEGYIIKDGSIKGSPMQWARRAIAMHDEFEADGIVVEVNQGGDMVAQTLRSVRPNIRVIEVRATRGKHVRAEPIAALYEQGRMHHVGTHAELEDEMVMFTAAGYEGENSPDRTDALVWLSTELFPSIITPQSEPEEPPQFVGSGGWMG